MNPAIRKIAAWARENRWRVEDDASGYTHFFAPDGRRAARYPATPSNPFRRMKELENELRKSGLEWPKPSKKMLRARREKEQRNGEATEDA